MSLAFKSASWNLCPEEVPSSGPLPIERYSLLTCPLRELECATKNVPFRIRVNSHMTACLLQQETCKDIVNSANKSRSLLLMRIDENRIRPDRILELNANTGYSQSSEPPSCLSLCNRLIFTLGRVFRDKECSPARTSHLGTSRKRGSLRGA